jgi:hypothetical protein
MLYLKSLILEAEASYFKTLHAIQVNRDDNARDAAANCANIRRRIVYLTRSIIRRTGRQPNAIR